MFSSMDVNMSDPLNGFQDAQPDTATLSDSLRAIGSASFMSTPSATDLGFPAVKVSLQVAPEPPLPVAFEPDDFIDSEILWRDFDVHIGSITKASFPIAPPNDNASPDEVMPDADGPPPSILGKRTHETADQTPAVIPLFHGAVIDQLPAESPESPAKRSKLSPRTPRTTVAVANWETVATQVPADHPSTSQSAESVVASTVTESCFLVVLTQSKEQELSSQEMIASNGVLFRKNQYGSWVTAVARTPPTHTLVPVEQEAVAAFLRHNDKPTRNKMYLAAVHYMHTGRTGIVPISYYDKPLKGCRLFPNVAIRWRFTHIEPITGDIIRSMWFVCNRWKGLALASTDAVPAEQRSVGCRCRENYPDIICQRVSYQFVSAPQSQQDASAPTEDMRGRIKTPAQLAASPFYSNSYGHNLVVEFSIAHYDEASHDVGFSEPYVSTPTAAPLLACHSSLFSLRDQTNPLRVGNGGWKL